MTSAFAHLGMLAHLAHPDPRYTAVRLRILSDDGSVQVIHGSYASCYSGCRGCEIATELFNRNLSGETSLLLARQ